MKTSKQGIDFIKSFESFSPRSYICPAGLNTIGYGHVIGMKDQFSEISELQAEEILVSDLAIAEMAIYRNVKISLSQNQFDALVSFVFNLGGGAFQRSTLRQKINYGAENDEINTEFLKWVFAGGKKLLGLIRRREAESNMYLA